MRQLFNKSTLLLCHFSPEFWDASKCLLTFSSLYSIAFLPSFEITHFCYQLCIDIFVFLSLERAPNIRSFRFHQTWICLCCRSKTCDLLLTLLLSPHISQVGKLKLKGESWAYLAKLGKNSGLPAPNLMFLSLHSIRCFDDLSGNNGQGTLDTGHRLDVTQKSELLVPSFSRWVMSNEFFPSWDTFFFFFAFGKQRDWTRCSFK